MGSNGSQIVEVSGREYVAVTGLYIGCVEVSKRALVLPGQNFFKFDANPVKYSFKIDAKSRDGVSFVYNVNVLIGPREDASSLKKFAMVDASEEWVKNYAQAEFSDRITYYAPFFTYDKHETTDEFDIVVRDDLRRRLHQTGLVLYESEFTPGGGN